MSSSNNVVSAGPIGIENFVKAVEAYDTACKSISKNPSIQRFRIVKNETKESVSEIFSLKAKLDTFENDFRSNLMTKAKILSFSDSEPNLVWEDLIRAKKELQDKCAELSLLHTKIQKTNFGTDDAPFTYDDYLNTKEAYKQAAKDHLQKNKSEEDLKNVLEFYKPDEKLFNKLEKVTITFRLENLKASIESLKANIENLKAKTENFQASIENLKINTKPLKRRLEFTKKCAYSLHFVATGIVLSAIVQRQLTIPLSICYAASCALTAFVASKL